MIVFFSIFHNFCPFLSSLRHFLHQFYFRYFVILSYVSSVFSRFFVIFAIFFLVFLFIFVACFPQVWPVLPAFINFSPFFTLLSRFFPHFRNFLPIFNDFRNFLFWLFQNFGLSIFHCSLPVFLGSPLFCLLLPVLCSSIFRYFWPAFIDFFFILHLNFSFNFFFAIFLI